jgi:hypothetical protein
MGRRESLLYGRSWNSGPDRKAPQRLKPQGRGIHFKRLTARLKWRTFPDAPHFQLTVQFPTTSTEEVREIFKRGGIEAVWDAAGLNPDRTATGPAINGDAQWGG